MRPALRQQAHKWLRAALADPKLSKDRLRTWQTEPGLAGVRDPAALDKLPPEEATAWREFWQAVSARL